MGEVSFFFFGVIAVNLFFNFGLSKLTNKFWSTHWLIFQVHWNAPQTTLMRAEQSCLNGDFDFGFGYFRPVWIVRLLVSFRASKATVVIFYCTPFRVWLLIYNKVRMVHKKVSSQSSIHCIQMLFTQTKESGHKLKVTCITPPQLLCFFCHAPHLKTKPTQASWANCAATTPSLSIVAAKFCGLLVLCLGKM